jgi:hypothetical protein
MVKQFSVKNWEEYQQYKDRSPKWIKLWGSLLDDYHFTSMSDVERSHLIGIWLLASKMDNKIPYDSKWVGSRISATSKIDLEKLVQSGFIVTEDSVQDGTDPYRNVPRVEESKRREDKDKRGFKKPCVQDVQEYINLKSLQVNAEKWLSYYEANGWKVGKNSMKDWKASLRTWHHNRDDKPPSKQDRPPIKPTKDYF